MAEPSQPHTDHELLGSPGLNDATVAPLPPSATLGATALLRATGVREPLAPACVLSFDASLVSGPRRFQRRSVHPFRSVVQRSAEFAVVAAAGPGAPSAAVTVELLAAMDVRQCIAIGRAGALDPDLAGGEQLVVERAISDEGTSARYGGHLRADAKLTGDLCGIVARDPVVAVTTDTPFRHTAAAIGRLRTQASVIEMEAAALFAAAASVGMQMALLVVVSDHYQPQWHMADSSIVSSQLAAALDVAEGVLTSS